MLEGLRARLMAPEIAAEAMRAYAEETNRLNRERRAGSEADRKALADVEKKLKDIVTAIEDGGYSRPLMMRLRELEAKHDELTERLSRAPVGALDSNTAVISEVQRRPGSTEGLSRRTAIEYFPSLCRRPGNILG